MMMEDGVSMETIFGDGSSSGGGGGLMGKLMGAGKRMLTGESLFMTTFTNTGSGKKHVYFASITCISNCWIKSEGYNGLLCLLAQ